MVIRSVSPDSLAAKFGLRAGDRVLSIEGWPMGRAPDWTAATGDWEVGRVHRWLVSRHGSPLNLEVVPARLTFAGRLLKGYDRYVIHLLSGFLLGLLNAWKRPGDPLARIGAWFLLTASIAFGFPQG